MEPSTIVVGGKNNVAVEGTKLLLERFREKTIHVTMTRTETGRDGFQRSFLKFARERGLSVVELEQTYPLENAIFVSLEYDRLLRPERFMSKRLINIHFSALPKYKGMYTSLWPIRLAEKECGVTLHEIDPGIDTGPIIAQRMFELGDDDTCKDLYSKYMANGIVLVKENLEQIVLGNYTAVPQPIENSSYFSRSSIDFANPVIDLYQTAINIKNQIRSLSFRDYQLPRVFDQNVFGCHIYLDRNYGKPGQLIAESADSFLFSTVDYNIRIFKDRLGELLESCRSGDLERVQRYLANSALVNEQDNFGKTPLIVAIECGQAEIVQKLQELGARADMPCYAWKLPIDYVNETINAPLRHKMRALLNEV